MEQGWRDWSVFAGSYVVALWIRVAKFGRGEAVEFFEPRRKIGVVREAELGGELFYGQ